MINKDDVKKIVISRTDRLGDVILTLPLISESRKVFKDARIFFFVNEYTKELITGYEGIDEIITEEEQVNFSGKYKLFRKIDPDLVINVRPRFDLALLFFLLGTKYRIGTGYRWYSFLYNCKVYMHRKNSDMHESDLNLNLLKTFFSEISAEKKFHFRYDKEEEKRLNDKLKFYKLDLNEKYIIIHPGSGGSAKDIPVSTLSEFIKLFEHRYSGYKIVITGIEKDKIISKELCNHRDHKENGRIVDLTGKLSLRELMILIGNSGLFISNSTGPIHIAGALNKKIIGFYPNEKHMSETRWGPISDKAEIIKPAAGSDDMQSISAEEIFNAAEKLLVK